MKQSSSQLNFRAAAAGEKRPGVIGFRRAVNFFGEEGMSATLNAYYGEFFLNTMPTGLQKFLFGFFGRILRIFGYKKQLSFEALKEKYVP